MGILFRCLWIEELRSFELGIVYLALKWPLLILIGTWVLILSYAASLFSFYVNIVYLLNLESFTFLLGFTLPNMNIG